MDRKFYLDLAASGLRMPIGTDLALHEQPDVPAVLLDGVRLGKVMETAARTWNTPLALALMDLMLEKDLILARLGIPAAEREQFHFAAVPTSEQAARITQPEGVRLTPRLQANLGALGYVARTSLLPVGMAIGPFSLMTKLLADPITPVFMAGTGATPAEEPEIAMVETVLELGANIILESVTAQAQAGAKAIVIAEPAANIAYFSPNQLAAGSDIYERYVMVFNRRIAQRCGDLGLDLIFHCCGELTDDMVRLFGTLDPVILSLGSSRQLWSDAALLPKNVVLFGNLPTKRFYSDDLVSLDDVRKLSRQTVQRMKHAGHPHILGSECDVLSVPGSEKTIKAKVHAMVEIK
jgi:uroporphyrinogen-III decarboxylase